MFKFQNENDIALYGDDNNYLHERIVNDGYKSTFYDVRFDNNEGGEHSVRILECLNDFVMEGSQPGIDALILFRFNLPFEILKGLAGHRVEQGLYGKHTDGKGRRRDADEYKESYSRLNEGQGGNIKFVFSQDKKRQVIHNREVLCIGAEHILDEPEYLRPVSTKIKLGRDKRNSEEKCGNNQSDDYYDGGDLKSSVLSEHVRYPHRRHRKKGTDGNRKH